MNKNGYVITLIVILSLIAAGLYLGYNYYSKEPNTKTQEITRSFQKYPNATSWLIFHPKSLCIYYFDGCTEAPSTISFTTSDQWSTIYAHYRDSLEKFGWTTNTKVITSIPDQINFTGDFSSHTCESALIKPKENTTEYKFSITCSSKV